MTAQSQPTDRILTVPNAITLVRLLMIPPFLWIALVLKHDLLAWSTGIVLGSTDWVDGWVARRFNQVSKIGVAIDPFVDRLAVLSIAIGCVLRGVVPWWAVAIVALRELLLLAAVPVIAAWGVERPAVTKIGKAGFFTVMWAFGFFFLVTVPDPPIEVFAILGWGFYVVGVVLAYAAAIGYLRTALESKRNDSGARSA